MPESGHTMSVTIDGDRIDFQVVCHEPVGAACRLHCAKPGCDWEEAIPHIEDETGDEHPMGDMGECNTCLWLNEDPIAIPELHEGPGEPLFDGMPIKVTWTSDDTYSWRGIEAEVPA